VNRRRWETVTDYLLMVLLLMIGAVKLGLEQYDTAVWVFLSCALLGVLAMKDRLLHAYTLMIDELANALDRAMGGL